jgi:tRNA A37 threonylcarbamoyladenosine dehydratase
MIKGFISYRFTGEKIDVLEKTLAPIQNKLKEVGIDAYCNFFDKDLLVRSKNFKQQDYVFDAYKTINNGVNLIFVLITSDNKSEGQILEFGYSIAKNIPIVVAIKEGVAGTYLPGMANLVIQYKDINDLLEKISETDFNYLIK